MKDETGAFTSANSYNDLKRKREDNESNEELASVVKHLICQYNKEYVITEKLMFSLFFYFRRRSLIG
jgi:hypothetical protein